MNIKKLSVNIGKRLVDLANLPDSHPDVQVLMKLSTNSQSIITIEIPATDEAASALGRLLYSQPEQMKGTNIPQGDFTPEQVTQLSRKFYDLTISVRTANCFEAQRWIYVWQVAEKNEAELLKTKDFGRKSLSQIKELLTELNLQLNMNLSSIKDQLPQPPR